jgi:hypothetical protein
MSKLALGPTQPLRKWATGLSPRLNLLASEAVHLPPSSAKVKNEWSCTFTSPICLHGTWRERLNLYHIYSPSPLPVSIPQTLHPCCVPVNTMESKDFTAHIFYLLTTCPPPDQEAKTLLSPTSLLHNPSWCTPAPLVHMATIPLAQHWYSCHPHQCLCMYNTPRSSCGYFFLDYWPWRWSTMIF